MQNLNTLESFRTKDELTNYFKEKGQIIIEEKMDALEQSYGQVKGNSNNLIMKQLDNIAGGVELRLCTSSRSGPHFHFISPKYSGKLVIVSKVGKLTLNVNKLKEIIILISRKQKNE